MVSLVTSDWWMRFMSWNIVDVIGCHLFTLVFGRNKLKTPKRKLFPGSQKWRSHGFRRAMSHNYFLLWEVQGSDSRWNRPNPSLIITIIWQRWVTVASSNLMLNDFFFYAFCLERRHILHRAGRFALGLKVSGNPLYRECPIRMGLGIRKEKNLESSEAFRDHLQIEETSS